MTTMDDMSARPSTFYYTPVRDIASGAIWVSIGLVITLPMALLAMLLWVIIITTKYEGDLLCLNTIYQT